MYFLVVHVTRTGVDRVANRRVRHDDPGSVITMEYVYAALILHEADHEISEESVTDVLEAAGVDVEESRAKALVAALEDVDIEEAVAEATIGAPAPAPAPAEAEAPEAEEEGPEEAEAEEEEPEEEEEATGEGLGELFG